MNIEHTAVDRFLNYVTIDTQSDPDSDTYPSTEKQKNLSRLLVKELQEMGVTDAHLDDYGYVYGTIPATTDKDVPVICFCSHVDTSPDSSGTGVQPVVHRNYQGGDIVLPGDTSVVISPKDHPELQGQIGNDIITASGTTLLGADDKSGVAEIMGAMAHLMAHPEIEHGKIRVLFTPDEEIGKGVLHVDYDKLGADFGYTLDGGERGTLEDETFSADGVDVTVEGFSIHPGYAKGKLENAIKIQSEIIDAMPKDALSPETTEGKEGYLHPVTISGNAELAVSKWIVRAFDEEGLKELEDYLLQLVKEVVGRHQRSSFKFEVQEQYRNMKVVLDQHPQVIENAVEAIKRAGMEPLLGSIRGGTDGTIMSFNGLPCPNLFAGQHAIHGRHEWISVQDMHRAVETIVHLVQIWAERA